MDTAKKKHVVVIGGGFAGLNFIQSLTPSSHYQVTLVDKHNYNYFTPLLYQVATGFLEPGSISYPFRKLLKNKNVTFRMAGVERVAAQDNKIYLTDGGSLNYDTLVFAAGAKPNFFGIESIQRNAIPLKSISDALYLRNDLVKRLEDATAETDPLRRRKLLTIVIAGGGPTGVEVAGMLAEMKESLNAEYPELRFEKMEIYVVDGADSLLAPMSEKTHKAAHKILTDLGIRVKLNVQVQGYEHDCVKLSDGEVIESGMLIWAAGVIANTFAGIDPASLGRGKRMITDGFNKVKGYDNVYAIGDIAIQNTDKAYPNGHPQLAQPAIQQGKLLAKNLKREVKGQAMEPFTYFDRGDMAIIGRKHALVDLFKQNFHIGGIIGLLSWLFIHLISLVSYNNMVKTFYGWAVSYLTRDQTLRMIFEVRKKTQVDEYAVQEQQHEHVGSHAHAVGHA